MFAKNDPSCLRQLIRDGLLNQPTGGLAKGYVQANVVILPSSYAEDFMRFCILNNKACPVLEVLQPGDPYVRIVADNADIRSDVARYVIYEKGQQISTTESIEGEWQNDFVTFLLGCSYTFDTALESYGIEVRHITNKVNDPTYISNIECKSTRYFRGPMAVSMRPIPSNLVSRAVLVTSRYPFAHGAPIHVGNPEVIGIEDMNSPEFGDPPEIKKGEIPIFWACGVTAQIVSNSIPFMITHASGYMFITDKRIAELELAYT